MNLEWKYIKRIRDNNVFEKFQKKYNIIIPQILKEYIIKFNAGMPNPACFDTPKKSGCVFNALFSYNVEDKCNIYFIYDYFNHENLLPFADDISGNIICIDLLDNKIKYINHETDEIELISNSLYEFMNSFYK